MAAAAPSKTADQLIGLFRVSGELGLGPTDSEHDDGRWELYQEFYVYQCVIELHPVRKRPLRYGQFTEGIQIRVSRDDLVEVFREKRNEYTGSAPYHDTMVAKRVPGLFAELSANMSFLPSLQNNEPFRAVLADFDASGGRVPMANRGRFLELQRSAAARTGIAHRLKEMERDDSVADTVFGGVVKGAGTGKLGSAFIDACTH